MLSLQLLAKFFSHQPTSLWCLLNHCQGIEAGIRPEVWPFLLEVFDHGSTYQQRQQQHRVMVRQYQQLLLQCQVSVTPANAVQCTLSC